MSDVFTKAKRSEVMSRIRGRGNKDTELAPARLLRQNKITGWRRHASLKFQVSSSRFQVRPDFIFRKRKVAIFVDGCFWHGCPKHCKYVKWLTKDAANNPPSPRERLRRTGRAFWRHKLDSNRRRDALVSRTLRALGWRVLRVWEHDLHRATRNAKHAARLVRRIQRAMV